MNVAIVGAGWAGLAAAVAGTLAGQSITIFEASRQLGGRARALPVRLPDGRDVLLDNGQHILIGAYTETLALMRRVGVDPEAALMRLPLDLRFADGSGLHWPDLPAPWDTLVALGRGRGWTLVDKASLLGMALRWRMGGFRCAASATVADLSARATERVRQELVEPLCVSALNLGADQASGALFLRVLRDALFAAPRGSNLLLPRQDLGALFPEPAGRWLAARGATMALGQRIEQLGFDDGAWTANGERFDRVVLACPAWDGARLLRASAPRLPPELSAPSLAWSQTADQLTHTAITTVYASASTARLSQPMVALRPGTGPAQFVFDRGLLGGTDGVLAFVASACGPDRSRIERDTLVQARTELGIEPQILRTVVERRAAFACTPQVQRPSMQIAPGLMACGDHVEGPYPSTLEGAVRSGLAVSR